MPTFHIQRYEICATTYEVEAVKESEAIAKLLDGKGQITFRSHEFVQIAETCGLSVEEHPHLAEELRALAVPVVKIIPSIRSIRRIE